MASMAAGVEGVVRTVTRSQDGLSAMAMERSLGSIRSIHHDRLQVSEKSIPYREQLPNLVSAFPRIPHILMYFNRDDRSRRPHEIWSVFPMGWSLDCLWKREDTRVRGASVWGGTAEVDRCRVHEGVVSSVNIHR